MIIFTKNTDSVIRAFLLAKLKGDYMVSEEGEEFIEREDLILRSDSYCTEELTEAYSKKFDRSAQWLFEDMGDSIKYLVGNALRHSASDKLTVIFQALEDAFTKIPSACLDITSENSRRLHTLSNEVSHEIWQMMGSIDFKPAPHNCVVGRPILKHDSADLILRELRNRFPNKRIVLILEDKAIARENGKVFEVQPKAYERYLEPSEEDSDWSEYCEEQATPARKRKKIINKNLKNKMTD